jgi:hypothetical protein
MSYCSCFIDSPIQITWRWRSFPIVIRDRLPVISIQRSAAHQSTQRVFFHRLFVPISLSERCVSVIVFTRYANIQVVRTLHAHHVIIMELWFWTSCTIRLDSFFCILYCARAWRSDSRNRYWNIPMIANDPAAIPAFAYPTIPTFQSISPTRVREFIVCNKTSHAICSISGASLSMSTFPCISCHCLRCSAETIPFLYSGDWEIDTSKFHRTSLCFVSYSIPSWKPSIDRSGSLINSCIISYARACVSSCQAIEINSLIASCIWVRAFSISMFGRFSVLIVKLLITNN